jgi:DNA-binding NarL/FixJ family response regulator
MERITVLVVESGSSLVRELVLALPPEAGVGHVLGPVAGADEALAVLGERPVDVVVVDLDRTDGERIVVRIRGAHGHVRVLGATSRPEAEVAAVALASGASGLLPRGGNSAELLRAFRRVLAGDLVLPATEVSSLVKSLEENAPNGVNAARVDVLTARELQILGALADGRSTVEIAVTLGISPLTVQSHVKNLFAKLDVHSKVAAVRVAWSSGVNEGVRSA